MKTAILALSFGTAVAFTPSQKVATRVSAVQASAFESEVGAQIPLGYFDPLRLLENADQERFDRLRFVEIKHGRISMLAVVGYLFGASDVRWSGFADVEHTIKFADVPGEL